MCDYNYSEYAFIDDETKRKIHISEYLCDEDLKKKVMTKKIKLVCRNGHTVKLSDYVSKKIQFQNYHLFVHDSPDLLTNRWHLNWQDNFDKKEVYLNKTPISVSNRRADVVIDNITLEFQHSPITEKEVDDRTKDHKVSGYMIQWIIDCTDDSISVVETNRCDDTPIYFIKFIRNEWKYTSFVSNDYIYLDKEGYIYRINPKYVKCDMIYTKNRLAKEDFILGLKRKDLSWYDDELEQCTVYLNQRGAGCGKTYESIQLLKGIDERFANKTTFIYLTKMHTAKDVILQELKEQEKDGKLCDIKSILIDQTEKCYKITYTNKNNINCKIIICTIDSFVYRLGNKDIANLHNDIIFGMINSLKDERHLEDLRDINNVKYSIRNGNFKKDFNVSLNKQTLAIIDEAQDLDTTYIEGFLSIMNIMNFDLYIIGDKLQSIWDENNVLTYLEKNDNTPNIKIIKNTGENIVRRFHNKKFKNIVNKIVPFKKFDLPQIKGIASCEESKCRHDENNACTILTMPNFYNTSKELDKDQVIFIEKIINILAKEVSDNKYLPRNFMFIFPYIQKNVIVNRLEARLEKYWKEQFSNEDYYNNVVMKDKHWKDTYDTKKYERFVFLHKNDEGKSINLKESEEATRLLSIHASKGTGREVVFLIGISEKSLHFYSNKTGSLQYESLLHVSLTRQKKKLVIAITGEYCDIYKRFKRVSSIDHNSKPTFSIIKNSFRMDEISSHSYSNQNTFDMLNNEFSITKRMHLLCNMNPKEGALKKIIEWDHHELRYAVFKYSFLMHIYNNETCDNNRDQFITIINKIRILPVIIYEHDEYFAFLKKIDSSRNNSDTEVIPVLDFSKYKSDAYIRYKNNICDAIKHIQYKISMSLECNKLPKLCPLESILLWYVIDIYKNGNYSKTTMVCIYNIFHCYDECYNLNQSEAKRHNDFECKCNEYFRPDVKRHSYNAAMRDIIVGHYETLSRVSEIYENYKKTIGKIKVTYNIMHNVSLECTRKEFKIWKNFWLIGYSDNNVIIFDVKPEINVLNYNEMCCKMIFNNYLIHNSKGNNSTRYYGKRIAYCIITFNSNAPKWRQFKGFNKPETHKKYYIREVMLEIIKKEIRNGLISYYKDHIDLVYRYIEYYYNDSKIKTEIGRIDNVLKKISNEMKEYPDKIFYDYIENFVRDLRKRIIRGKIRNLFDDLKIEEFREDLKDYIFDFVDKMIGYIDTE